MSKRKYLIGAAVAVLSISVAGLAQADYTFQSQELDVNTSSPKQDKKKPGAINSLFVDVITNYTGDPSGGGDVDKKANNTKVYFPKDYVFNTSGLPQCDPDAGGFGTSDTAGAQALCGAGSPGGNAQVGTGSASIVGVIPGITAVVTAFNGTQPAGQDTILLHSRTSVPSTTVLVGTLKPSDLGGFGTMLDVPVPPLPLGLAISDFKTTILKLQLPSSGKAASSAKKKKKAKKYYVMAKCSKKKWNFQANTTYDVGAATVATDQNTCKQKKSKKKKKK